MKTKSGWRALTLCRSALCRSALCGSVLCVAMLWLPASYAVMPPEAEARAALARIERMAAMRAEAPEKLRVQIQSATAERVDGNLCPAVETWTVEATVVSLERGTAAPGQRLHLYYEVEHYRCPGPVREHWPTLQADTEIDALLTCEGEQCEPAAGPMSFMSDSAFATEHARRIETAKRYAPKP